MKRVYLVLGEGGVGKSTLIRSLTGIGRQRRTYIRLVNKEAINIWCWLRSLQEMDTPMSPEKMIDEITRADEAEFIDYLIPLRIKSGKKYQGIDMYMQAISGCPDIKEIKIVVLGVDKEEYEGLAQPIPADIPVTYIRRSRQNTANENAFTVRKAWGWL